MSEKYLLHTGEKLPEAFVARWLEDDRIDGRRFLSGLCQAPETSVKLNVRKFRPKEETPEQVVLTAESVGENEIELDGVRWCPEGFYLSHRPRFTLNPLLHAGLFYVQDASSMIYGHLVAEGLRYLDLSRPPALLDLCAAPGGKTTSAINALPDGSRVVANEVMPRRAAILRENLIKWGYTGSMVASSPTARFASEAAGVFDIVAVDAPCSGEGMMRKEGEAARQWSDALVASCAALQREVLADAAAVLKPGGIMIYSTCTFNEKENEENLRYAVEQLGLDPLDPRPELSWGIGRELSGDYPALRFMPGFTRGEGLFAAMLRKPGEHVAPGRREDKFFSTISNRLRMIMPKYPSIMEKGGRQLPAPELPFATDFDSTSYPCCDLSPENALRYLRRESITLPPGIPKGYVTVCFQGHPIGMVKNLGTRANNLFPAEWRIRNL